MESKGERIIGRKVTAEELMVSLLGLNLRRQLDSISACRTAYGAMRAAQSYEGILDSLSGHLGEAFGLSTENRPRAELTLDIADAAEKEGFDARALREVLLAIHDRAKAEKASGPYAAARVARRHLRGRQPTLTVIPAKAGIR